MDIEQVEMLYSNDQTNESKTKKPKKKQKFKLDNSKDDVTKPHKSPDINFNRKTQFFEESANKDHGTLSPASQKKLAHSQNFKINDKKKTSHQNKHAKLNSTEEMITPQPKENDKNMKINKTSNKLTNNKNNKSNNKTKIKDDKVDIIHKFNVKIYTIIVKLNSPQRLLRKCFKKWKKLLKRKKNIENYQEEKEYEYSGKKFAENIHKSIDNTKKKEEEEEEEEEAEEEIEEEDKEEEKESKELEEAEEEMEELEEEEEEFEEEEVKNDLEEIQEKTPDEEESHSRSISINKKNKQKYKYSRNVYIILRRILRLKNKIYKYFQKWYKISTLNVDETKNKKSEIKNLNKDKKGNKSNNVNGKNSKNSKIKKILKKIIKEDKLRIFILRKYFEKWKNILNKKSNEKYQNEYKITNQKNKKEKNQQKEKGKDKEKLESTTDSNTQQKMLKIKKHRFKIANDLLRDTFNPNQTDDQNNDNNSKNMSKNNSKKNNVKKKSIDKTKKLKKNILLFIEKLENIITNLDNKNKINSLKKLFNNLKEITFQKKRNISAVNDYNILHKNLTNKTSAKSKTKHKLTKQNKYGIEHLEMDIDKNSYTETSAKFVMRAGSIVDSISSENDNRTVSIKGPEPVFYSKKHHKKHHKKKDKEKGKGKGKEKEKEKEKENPKQKNLAKFLVYEKKTNMKEAENKNIVQNFKPRVIHEEDILDINKSNESIEQSENDTNNVKNDSIEEFILTNEKLKEIRQRHNKNKVQRYLLVKIPNTKKRKYDKFNMGGRESFSKINKKINNENFQKRLLKLLLKTYCRKNKYMNCFDKWFDFTFNEKYLNKVLKDKNKNNKKENKENNDIKDIKENKENKVYVKKKIKDSNDNKNNNGLLFNNKDNKFIVINNDIVDNKTDPQSTISENNDKESDTINKKNKKKHTKNKVKDNKETKDNKKNNENTENEEISDSKEIKEKIPEIKEPVITSPDSDLLFGKPKDSVRNSLKSNNSNNLTNSKNNIKPPIINASKKEEKNNIDNNKIYKKHNRRKMNLAGEPLVEDSPGQKKPGGKVQFAEEAIKKDSGTSSYTNKGRDSILGLHHAVEEIMKQDDEKIDNNEKIPKEKININDFEKVNQELVDIEIKQEDEIDNCIKKEKRKYTKEERVIVKIYKKALHILRGVIRGYLKRKKLEKTFDPDFRLKESFNIWKNETFKDYDKNNSNQKENEKEIEHLKYDILSSIINLIEEKRKENIEYSEQSEESEIEKRKYLYKWKMITNYQQPKVNPIYYNVNDNSDRDVYIHETNASNFDFNKKPEPEKKIENLKTKNYNETEPIITINNNDNNINKQKDKKHHRHHIHKNKNVSTRPKIDWNALSNDYDVDNSNNNIIIANYNNMDNDDNREEKEENNQLDENEEDNNEIYFMEIDQQAFLNRIKNKKINNVEDNKERKTSNEIINKNTETNSEEKINDEENEINDIKIPPQKTEKYEIKETETLPKKNQEQINDVKDKEDKNKENENNEVENKEDENNEVQNNEVENKEGENKDDENNEVQNNELENKEDENKESENKENENKDDENKDDENKEEKYKDDGNKKNNNIEDNDKEEKKIEENKDEKIKEGNREIVENNEKEKNDSDNVNIEEDEEKKNAMKKSNKRYALSEKIPEKVQRKVAIEIIIRRKKKESDNENNEPENIKSPIKDLEYKKEPIKQEEQKQNLPECEEKENEPKNEKKEETIEKKPSILKVKNPETFPEKNQSSEKESFEKINSNINETKEIREISLPKKETKLYKTRSVSFSENEPTNKIEATEKRETSPLKVQPPPQVLALQKKGKNKSDFPRYRRSSSGLKIFGRGNLDVVEPGELVSTSKLLLIKQRLNLNSSEKRLPQVKLKGRPRLKTYSDLSNVALRDDFEVKQDKIDDSSLIIGKIRLKDLIKKISKKKEKNLIKEKFNEWKDPFSNKMIVNNCSIAVGCAPRQVRKKEEITPMVFLSKHIIKDIDDIDSNNDNSEKNNNDNEENYHIKKSYNNNKSSHSNNSQHSYKSENDNNINDNNNINNIYNKNEEENNFKTNKIYKYDDIKENEDNNEKNENPYRKFYSSDKRTIVPHTIIPKKVKLIEEDKNKDTNSNSEDNGNSSRKIIKEIMKSSFNKYTDDSNRISNLPPGIKRRINTLNKKNNNDDSDSRNHSIEEYKKYFPQIYELKNLSNKVQNNTLNIMKNFSSTLFDQIESEKFIEYFKRYNKTFSAYQILCLYTLYNKNHEFFDKKFAFTKWKKLNKIFKHSSNEFHVKNANGHCVTCKYKNYNHCPECSCLHNENCLKCECKQMKIKLKKILIRYKFMQKTNPKRYYFYIWYKKVFNVIRQISMVDDDIY